eukprot:CAMPEP_0173455376 /NCGR_PEP_ID=MMETSP1357-20121228/54173_1 /TAXON_ID=77926 /ORGANISM="Hemiselmis rufescens, Strain PCC563" /LENGTH=167 /DNA_ID=CAMNT_0014422501 /DNA_START=20 /DNA_END=520 /DNA_ORIENTATION=+
MTRRVGDMEEYLNEVEYQIDDEQETHANKLIESVHGEGVRRSVVREGMREYRGPDGEYVNLACISCGRMQVVKDKDIQCTLEEELKILKQLEDAANPALKKRKKKKKTKGVDPPFDSIIVDTDRWSKEKGNRLQLLTVQKVLKTITNILCEKVLADMADTASEHPRE